jgi:hypothetical protein
VLAISEKSIACTSAIITDKVTPDGRPLLWKHRDTGFENNRMVYAQGAKYSYIGLVNSCDVNDLEIWAGTNSAGFSIMNTASYNLKDSNDKTDFEDREGIIMRMALEVCATLEDFEHFLDTITKPLGIETNFGVIDAFGGAAFFEMNNFAYTKFDANDAEIAPNGYLIRTNYSYSGRTDEGMGYIRHENAVYLFENHPTQQFTPKWIFSSASRSYYHSLLEIDLKTQLPALTIDQDYIPRNSSSSSIVFQGVKKGEPVERTTTWIALGFPSASIALPLWIAGGEQLPEIMTRTAESNNAPLCDKVVALKNKVFPIKRGSGRRYMDFSLLYNKNSDGIIQKLQPFEEEIFEKTYKKIDEWDASGWNEKNIQEYYKYLDNKVLKIYYDLFGL